MNKFPIILLGCLVIGLFLFGLNNYHKSNQLEKENQQLQEKIKNLTSQNQFYQKQMNAQLQEQTTKEDKEDAKTKAVKFIKVYHNTSLTQQERLQQLKILMVPEAFSKKFGSPRQQQTNETSNVQGRIDIKNIQSFQDQNKEKVKIDYDYIGSIDNTENFVEKMNIIVHLVVHNGKWLVKDFEVTYIEGPEDHVH